MHRGDALERGAELAVFLIDAPQVHFSVTEDQLHLLAKPNPSLNPSPSPKPHQVHFSVTEDQLHLLAKLLEYSFNYSRFLPNW